MATNYRYPVTFEIQDEAADFVDDEPVWVPYESDRADIEELSGRELVTAQQTSERVTARITTRFHPKIRRTPDMRINHAGTIWMIASIVTKDLTNPPELIFMCKK